MVLTKAKALVAGSPLRKGMGMLKILNVSAGGQLALVDVTGPKKRIMEGMTVIAVAMIADTERVC